MMTTALFLTGCSSCQKEIVCKKVESYKFYPMEYNLTKVEDINLTGKVHFLNSTNTKIVMPFDLWKSIVLANNSRKHNERILKMVVKWRELDIENYNKFINKKKDKND